jgi:hypothetical protein
METTIGTNPQHQPKLIEIQTFQKHEMVDLLKAQG